MPSPGVGAVVTKVYQLAHVWSHGALLELELEPKRLCGSWEGLCFHIKAKQALVCRMMATHTEGKQQMHGSAQVC